MWAVRLLPRINLKRAAWPGGPQVDEVLKAQLVPPPASKTEREPSVAVELLLLLR